MGVIVEARSGKIEGVETDGCLAFKGIAFAAPPVGDLRFLPPVREAAWSDVRDASAFGADVAQNVMILEQMMGTTSHPKSEDALFLNVWTPSLDGTRPVMVWIHGGAFQFGAGSTPWYDGTRFANDGDVVLVTINYRLGPLGFLYLGDLCDDPALASSGNLGILDQVAALEWVQECISEFGGDPANVTIFGESAGAGSVATLMGTPAARPGALFHKAIAQSGAASWGLTPEHATNQARRVATALGIDATDVAAWRAVTADALVEASSVLGLETDSATLPFAPVHDGVVLPQPPLDAIAGGSAKGVALLTGTNLDEMTLFNIIDPALGSMDDAALAQRISEWIRDGADTLLAGYRANRADATTGDLWTAISTDAVFRVPMLRLLDAHAPHGELHAYLFTWPTPAFGGALKSCHAVEIPFVFDNLHQPGAAMFLGDDAPRDTVAAPMHRAWHAFARSGTPTHGAIPAWAPYDANRRPTMRIDTTWELLDDPYGVERALWDGWSGRGL